MMADFYVVLNSWSDTDLYAVTRRSDLFRFTNRCRMDLTDLEVALVGIYQQPTETPPPSKDTKPTPKPPKPPAPPKPPKQPEANQSSAQSPASGSATSGAQPPAASGSTQSGTATNGNGPSRPKRSLPERKEPEGAEGDAMLSDQPARPLATVGAVVVVECDAVVTTLFGSTCAQMLRVIDHFGDYDPQYVRCMDGPTTTMTVNIRPAYDGAQMSSVPANLLLVLHFRKRQMCKGGWSPSL